MDAREVGRYWDHNAPVWTELTRAGYDVYRDELNTPAFLGLLPDVSGAAGLDIGCGEGHNTRLLAQQGARMTAADISWSFLRAAREREVEPSPRIAYVRASAESLPFAPARFDFATAFMCLMDMPDLSGVLAEVFRVLRPGGFLQFSIEHPVMATPVRGWEVDDTGQKVARRFGEYFSETPWVDEWIFNSAPEHLRQARRSFRIPRFPRTLSTWLTTVARSGFTIEEVAEPRAGDDAIARHPKLAATRQVPFFLHVRCRRQPS